MTSIWHRRGEIDRARRKKMEEAMREYDEQVYYPARKELIADCAAEGHSWQFTHVGPAGGWWFTCNKCNFTCNKCNTSEFREDA